jgi:alpha-1,2-mannosyltransferase
MSLFSPYVGIVTRGTPTGKSPVDDLYFKWMIGAAVFFVVLEISYLALAGLPPLAKPWADGTDFAIGRDFINTWMGGRSMFSGGPAVWFDVKVYSAALREMVGTTYPETYWSYPPHLVLFIWPFGLMPYLLAYIAWCAIGIALYVFACSSAIPRDRRIFLVLAPGIAVCAFFGQNGFYTAALLIGGMLARERRPVLAGILFGLLTIKPQLGLLLPLVLLLERRWVTIASTIVTVAALVTATAMLFGWSVWIDYLHKVVPQQMWLTEHADGLLFSLVGTVFFGARLIHLPLPAAWAVQYTVAALAVAGLIWTYWKRRDPALSFAYLVTATFLATPYILNYDMVVFGFVVALLRERADNTPRDHWLLLTVWALPVTMIFAGVIWIPLAPLVLMTFAVWLLRRLARVEGRAVAAVPEQATSAAA